MPKVSIVLPTYNGSQYLSDSIESVINQTYMDWELIIVDDCSTDDTLKIAKKYAEMDERISVVHNEFNKKLPTSLNIGFEYAKGEYFAWTSDDNFYENEAIEKMVRYLDYNQNTPMVRADMILIDEKGTVIADSEAYDNHKMLVNNYVGACFLYRRSVAQSIGKYDDSLFCVEDYDYWIRIMKHCGPIGNIQEKLYRYRNHSESLSSTKRRYVETQLNLMRKKHLDFYIDNMQSDEKELFALYYLLLNCGWDREYIINKIGKCPFIENDMLIDNRKSCVVYGAGYYGQKAYELLDGNVAFFIDKNKNLIGTKKNDVDIIGIKEYLKDKTKYNIIVALSLEKAYEAIVDLKSFGINQYTTFTYLECQLKKENV